MTTLLQTSQPAIDGLSGWPLAAVYVAGFAFAAVAAWQFFKTIRDDR